jgi:hypothetical protein
LFPFHELAAVFCKYQWQFSSIPVTNAVLSLYPNEYLIYTGNSKSSVPSFYLNKITTYRVTPEAELK